MRASAEAFNQREKVKQDINALTSQLSNQAHAFKEQYSIQIRHAKNQWNADRVHFEKEKLQKLLPSRNGIKPTGTPLTQSYSSHRDQLNLAKEVGTCLADVVDTVDSIALGTVQNEHFSEPFVRPAPPAGFDAEALERGKQLETFKRNELNALTLRVRSCEDERLHAWKKLLKVKGEHKMQQQLCTSTGTWRNIQLDANNHSKFPMPALQQSGLETLPNPGNLGNASSFTPRVRKVPSSSEDANRYSLSAVRKRIAPGSAPKKAKDGLRHRPRGRPKQGMD